MMLTRKTLTVIYKDDADKESLDSLAPKTMLKKRTWIVSPKYDVDKENVDS